MRQSACLANHLITVNNFVAYFSCTPLDRALDSLLVGPCCSVHQDSTNDFLFMTDGGEPHNESLC